MVEASQYGQALPCTIDTFQVLATVNTEDFSSTTPRIVVVLCSGYTVKRLLRQSGESHSRDSDRMLWLWRNLGPGFSAFRQYGFNYQL